VIGAGISAPGVFDHAGGVVVSPPNFPRWLDTGFGRIVEQETGIATFIDNDANAMALAEMWFGAARGYDNFACILADTGVGGGLVVNGDLYRGAQNAAGEIGHTTVCLDGPRCDCGNFGCLELYASGPAIASMGIKEVIQGHTTCIGDLAGHDLNRITTEVIFQAARDGDAVACEILRRAGRYLGIAVGNILAVISPQKVIFGGGVSQAGDLLLRHVREKARERVLVIPVDRVEFVIAELGPDAGMIGAALWAARRCQP
jgi:glucokinase